MDMKAASESNPRAAWGQLARVPQHGLTAGYCECIYFLQWTPCAHVGCCDAAESGADVAETHTAIDCSYS